MNLTAIGIIAIICWTIVKLTEKGKKPQNNKSQPDVDTVNMQKKLEAMEERIAVLEAIVTDEKYALRREFENLKKDKAA